MMDNKLRYVVTYMEMTAPPVGELPGPPNANVALRHVADISVPFYRRLYKDVGEDWLWWERLVLSDQALGALLKEPGVAIHVLYVADQPAGFAELDCRNPRDVEIRYFGLTPRFIGRGLGGWMLEKVVRIAWGRSTRRVALNTCEIDHPGALAFYERHGFLRCGSEVLCVEDPRLSGLLPISAAPHWPPSTTTSSSHDH